MTDTPQAPQPVNYIIALACHYTCSLLLVRCQPEDIDKHVRAVQFQYSQANVEVFALAGEKSLFVPGVHLKLITRHGAKDYVRRAADSIRAFWGGKERSHMDQDINLLLDMLRDHRTRLTSKPASDGGGEEA